MPGAATVISGLLIFAFLALLIWAAIEDFRHFKIPNRIPLIILAIYPLYVISAPDPVGWQLAAAMAGVVLLVGFGFFTLGVFGAGDAKLLTATMLWVGQPFFMMFMGVTVLAAVLVLLVVAYSTALRFESAGGDRAAARSLLGALGAMRYVPFRKLIIPYGVAIAAGGSAAAIGRLAALTG